jgi:hypothetical protein
MIALDILQDDEFEGGNPHWMRTSVSPGKVGLGQLSLIDLPMAMLGSIFGN